MKFSIKNFYAVAIVMIAIVVGGVSMDKTTDTNDIVLANVEALTENEVGSGSSIPCHSSAIRDYNRAYVDCASCTRKEGWKGTGTQASCMTN